MDRILVEVYLPAAARAYDVYIPFTIRLHEVLLLMAASLAELAEGCIISSDDTVICDRVTGVILNINMSAEELGLHNGSRLMLI